MISKKHIKDAIAESIGTGLGDSYLQGFWWVSSSRETFGAEVDPEGVVTKAPIERYVGQPFHSVVREMLDHPGVFRCARIP